MTIQLTFTPDDLAALSEMRYLYPHPIVQRRAETLWLKSFGLPHHQIANIAGVCENTMRDYFALYQTGGVEGLKVLHSYRPTSALQPQAPTLEAQSDPSAAFYDAAGAALSQSGHAARQSRSGQTGGVLGPGN